VFGFLLFLFGCLRQVVLQVAFVGSAFFVGHSMPANLFAFRIARISSILKGFYRLWLVWA